MLISTKGRYALRVMLELAQGAPGECMPLPVIAARQGISEKYLESIIAVLSRAGLVEGQRGKGGGYRLSRALKDYSVGEIVRLTEGSLAPVSCLEGENTCPRAGKCLSLPVWEKLDALINGYLDSVSLADLVSDADSSGCGVGIKKNKKLSCQRHGSFFVDGKAVTFCRSERVRAKWWQTPWPRPCCSSRSSALHGRASGGSGR